MELSWTTFVLEIINFLVLIWILKHFFYRPVQDIISRRRAAIEATLKEATEREQHAQTLQAQYENRLTDWDKERQAARATLNEELATERKTKLDELQQQLDQLREKNRQLDVHRQAEVQRQLQTQALTQAARFATKLLQYGAGVEVETRLLQLWQEQLAELPEEQLTRLRQRCAENTNTITIATAFALSKEQQQQLSTTLATALGKPCKLDFTPEPTLLAGLRVTIGPMVLGLNLQDELKGFADWHHELTTR